MNDAAKTETKKPAMRYYLVGKDEPRVIKAPTAYAAIMHAFEPLIEVATTDQVLAFHEAGGTIETAGAQA